MCYALKRQKAKGNLYITFNISIYQYFNNQKGKYTTHVNGKKRRILKKQNRMSNPIIASHSIIAVIPSLPVILSSWIIRRNHKINNHASHTNIQP
jgi:hypothetical protein